MSTEAKAYNLEIIAGPCSIDSDNVHELHDIAQIDTPDGPAMYGVRVVGLKSRTNFIEPDGSENNGMGIDFAGVLELEQNPQAKIILPSVEIAREVAEKTGLVVASEIMMPDVQMQQYVDMVPEGQGLFWSPAVNGLGWQARQKARIASANGWDVGIKNPKFLGVSYADALDPEHKPSPLETTWAGQASYAYSGGLRPDGLVLIHRGVDVPDKGDNRNALVHEVAGRVKDRYPGSRLYLDPTHSLGPKRRNEIIDTTLDLMTKRRGDGFLYDGVIFEAGTSKTDTKEHVTLDELAGFANEVSKFRKLRRPPARADIFVAGRR